ncbi:hypothetical protein LTR53_008206 [Teratosphaeriaceae sp. CCFEE 6253]|nr:hypothetical protein LTR53_008206 [Teratosphaeriaceae sp. CCFEE 6253]
MKNFALTAVAALLASTTSAAAIARRDTSDLVAAVKAWHDDTGAVSAFLDAAQTTISAADAGATIDLTATAGPALIREQNEADPQKSTIEGILCAGDASCASFSAALAAAKAKIEAGPFQNVVDILQTLSDNVNDVEQARVDINSINTDQITILGLSEGRCEAVLPAIDVYFQAAASFLADQGDTTSLKGFTAAVRPGACNGVAEDTFP